MAAEPEQIGPLIFVENPDYPYPFTVTQAPRFWMEETTGTLAPAVEIYLRGERLAADQLALLQIYLRQYLERAVMADDADRPRLLGRVARVHNTLDLERLAEALAEAGVEPF